MKIFIGLKVGADLAEPNRLKLAMSEELYSLGKMLGIPEEQWRQFLRGIRRIY